MRAGEKSLCFKRRHAAHSRRCDRLSKDLVFGIAGADHVSDNRIPADAYLGVALDARLVGLIGSQNVAPVNQRDFGREIGEEESLFDGGISSADHHDLFALEEESIARSAGG